MNLADRPLSGDDLAGTTTTRGKRLRTVPGHRVALAFALTATTTGLLAAPAHAAEGPSTATSSRSSEESQGGNAFRRAWDRVVNWAGGDDTPVATAIPKATSNQNVELASAPAGSTTAAANTTAGTTMPTGDLPGWKQVFADDFSTPVALGGFPGTAYSSRWTGYDGFTDTSGAGNYTPGKVLSVGDGALDMHLRTEGGKALTAAPVPVLDGEWGGWTYGRYSVRFRADAVQGYKTAWLLWPDSGDWNEGEIDFPEGDLSGTVQAFNHEVGNPAHNALAVDTGASFTDWHTATTEWTPDGVTFTLDGKVVGHSDVSPNTPMHLVLQTETAGGTPPADASGHVQVDWVTMYRQA